MFDSMSLARRLSGEPHIIRNYARKGWKPQPWGPVPKKPKRKVPRPVQPPKPPAQTAPRPLKFKIPYKLKGFKPDPIFVGEMLAKTLSPLVQWGNMIPAHYDMRGWTLQCDNGFPLGPKPKIYFANKGNSNNCSATCTWPATGDVGVTIPADAVIVFLGRGGLAPGPCNREDRMNRNKKYIRETVGTETPWKPDLVPYAPPPYLPVPWPAVDPLPLPIGQPVPRPVPIPYPLIPYRPVNDPNRDPVEQPGGGEPTTKPGAGSRSPVRWYPPDEVPAIEIPIEPGPPEQPIIVRPPIDTVHVRAPPSRRVRERKFSMSARDAKFIGWLLGLITESADMIDVFWKALDPEIRNEFDWRGTGIQDRLVFILENLDRVDRGQLVAQFISNQLEDKAFGKFGKQAKEMNQKLFDEFGIDLQGRLPKAYLRPDPGVADRMLDRINAWIEENGF